MGFSTTPFKKNNIYSWIRNRFRALPCQKYEKIFISSHETELHDSQVKEPLNAIVFSNKGIISQWVVYFVCFRKSNLLIFYVKAKVFKIL